MYRPRNSFTPPPDNAVLWRYISFTKFVSLLTRKALFFARADKLGDPYEGSLSQWNVNLSLTPNPPMDGVRIAAGWVRELQGRWLGSIGVDWRSADGLQSPHRAPMALCGSCDARDGERIRSRELSQTGVARVCGEVGAVAGWQSAGSGMARSRAMARVNWVSQGQCWGRCRVRRRAERVIRPTRAKNRRLRVLVVAIRSPRPMRAVQRARLCAITCTASQAPLAPIVTYFIVHAPLWSVFLN